MNLVFFEGFNYNNNDTVKLDPNYWSSPDAPSISFGNGRTNNAVYIANSDYASGQSANKKLNLTNFTSPLVDNNALGIGFWNNASTLKPECHLLSLYSGATELLSINIIQTTYSSNNDSFGLEVVQDGIQKGIYDFKAVVGYNYSFFQTFGSNSITSETYLEFYIDPKNTNSLRIRINGIDMINQSSSTTTSIVGFSSIDKISLYGCHDTFAYELKNRAFDDFYLTGGNTIDDTLLGSNVRIYQLNTSSNSSSNMQWSSNTSTQASVLNSNDGDNSYCFANTVNSTALFNMSDLPVASGSIGGIRLSNTARKVSDNVSFTNVYASGEGASVTGIGTTYNLTDASYKSCNSFVFKNPLTNNDWTIEEINSMQLGFKKLS